MCAQREMQRYAASISYYLYETLIYFMLFRLISPYLAIIVFVHLTTLYATQAERMRSFTDA
jgi:hypothetical protein